jgi:hypothetical protein
MGTGSSGGGISGGTSTGTIAGTGAPIVDSQSTLIEEEDDIDCDEWFVGLIAMYQMILRMKAEGRDTALLKRQFERSAALFFQNCPEYERRLPRF